MLRQKTEFLQGDITTPVRLFWLLFRIRYFYRLGLQIIG
jgi:hypothetical protein